MIYIIQDERGRLLGPNWEWCAPGGGREVLPFRNEATAIGWAAIHGGKVVPVQEPPTVAAMVPMRGVGAAPSP